jgi:hypothetical protein
MDWFVVRHPGTGGVGVVAETALDHHRDRGWTRVSDALTDGEKDQVVPAQYADAPDLDTKPASKTSTKEQ